MGDSSNDISRWLYWWRKDSEAKGFKILFESLLFICKKKSFKWPKKGAYFASKFFRLFPTIVTFCLLFKMTKVSESCNGWLFATLTIYWNSELHLKSPTHAIHYPRGRTMHGCEHQFQERMDLSPFFSPGNSFVILRAWGATATSQVSD